MTLDATTPTNQATLDTHAEEIRDLKTEVNTLSAGTSTLDVENNADSVTLATSDLNAIQTMDSASAKIITLPQVTADHIGMWIRVYKLGAGDVTVRAGGSDSIPGGTEALNSTAGDADQANIWLEVLAAGKWYLAGLVGTWAIS